VLKWEDIESSDYKKYINGLRTAGFPEELIRAIIIADVESLYAAREERLRAKPVPHDAAVAERQAPPTAEDWDRLRQLRQVEVEKQAVLKEILGIDVPREMFRTPTSRNYEAYDYALEQIPPERREIVQAALENFWQADDELKQLDHASYVQAYRQKREEFNATALQVLTPAEFERFEMNSTPAGTELARRTTGMDPNDDEMLAMFQLAYKCWNDSGGVYGLWHAVRVPSEQIAAAEQAMETGLQQALGPDRYLDYQMAVTATGQQLRNLAARYDIPRETIAQAFALQTEADQLARTARVANATVSADGSSPAPAQSPAQKLAEVQAQLEQVLGTEVWQAWQDGRRRQVSLDP